MRHLRDWRRGAPALLILLTLIAFGRATRRASADALPPYQHPITVAANGFARTDKPVEVALNFTPLLQAQGGSGAFDPASVRVVEVDGGGTVIDNNVPFQFDRAADYSATGKARGVLTFLMKGATAANATRHYRVHFDVTGGGYTLPAFPDQVAATDGVAHKGYQSIRLQTAAAEYFYHKPGGGFATLFDANNNDWINWNTAAGGAGDYRGIPNMVHPNDGGFFHPGRNSVTTTLVADGPLKATFRSVSDGGAWTVQWDVFPTYARMTVIKAGTTNYWFLYEGVPGGALQPATDRMTRSNGDSIPASGTWTTDIPGDEWVFASDPNVGRSLFLAHHQDDTKVDGYYADGSNMTVFGFGRSANQRLLNGLPGQFTFGFADATTLNGVRPVVEGAYKPLTVTGANDDGGSPGPVCDARPYSVYYSPRVNKTVAGIVQADEDVIRYDGTTCEWSVVFDGTAAGLPAAANVDSLAIKDGDLYLSFLAPLAVPGIPGTTDDSDVVKYSGGAFSLTFDGSAHGLTTDAEDVDALAFDETGKLLLSTVGAYTVTGLPKGGDEDLLRFDNGAWELRFDGSHNAGLAAEDVAGASVGADGVYYLSVLDAFAVGGVKGNGLDVIKCIPSSLGDHNTSCAYSKFWNASALGLPAFDAIDIQAQ